MTEEGYSQKGRRPHLQAIIDLTTLEKSAPPALRSSQRKAGASRGQFKDFEGAVSIYNNKRGLHLVVLFL